MNEERICPKCGHVMDYNSYFGIYIGRYVCLNCGHESTNKEEFVDSEIKPGMIFKGNVNDVEMEVLRIETDTYGTESGNFREGSPKIVLRDINTNNVFRYGLDAFKHCNLTLVKEN